MAADDPVWSITGCSTGFGHDLARLVLGGWGVDAVGGRMAAQRAGFEPWRDRGAATDYGSDG